MKKIDLIMDNMQRLTPLIIELAEFTSKASIRLNAGNNTIYINTVKTNIITLEADTITGVGEVESKLNILINKLITNRRG